MTATEGSTFPVLVPDLQVAFFHRLEAARRVCLREALADAVQHLHVPQLDRELAEFVPATDLAHLAASGVRGEVLFPVPLVLAVRPSLLGYYRLLYGLSEKAFYHHGPFGCFRIMEDRGALPERCRVRLPDLCRSLVETGVHLLSGVGSLTLDRVHELQLLTLGPAFRGSELNRIGQEATEAVRVLFRQILGPALVEETRYSLGVVNAAGRRVTIIFADDPDIRVVEHLPTGEQGTVSIEIKGGVDSSNIYNRIGEAEKSHLKARARGFTDFWTIVRADFNADRASRDSPTTRRFFHLDALSDLSHPEHALFRDCVSAAVGIPTP